MKSFKFMAKPIAALIVASTLAACAPGPRFVQAISGDQKSMKFVYAQMIPGFFSDKLVTGVVRCDVGEKDASTNCRDIPIEFKEN